jgi:hypothetical protein
MPSEQTTVQFFQESHVPADTSLVGMSALIHMFGVSAPLRQPSCVSSHHIKSGIRDAHSWRIYDKRYAPADTQTAHLTFALKHEDIDLTALKRIFEAMPEAVITDFVMSNPGGSANRRAWFLYEFLTSRMLDIEVPPKSTIVEVLDSDKYFVIENAPISRRHRVKNNLPGNSDFCPLIRRTALLEGFINANYAKQAKTLVTLIGTELIARAASFLLLADTKATFAIEGETPSLTRLQRWARTVQQAGKYELNVSEFERLQKILIEDTRFVKTGLRERMVYLGKGDSVEDILPEFIPAKVEDLHPLLNGLVGTNQLMTESGFDPVLQAAAIAFGFVYIHPFEDGNGRIHRCIIHNILARRSFSPGEMFFPVSSVMASEIKEYEKTLQSHSAPLMPYVEWQPQNHGIKVVNDTADFYKYFDCTNEAEFLYRCIARAVEHDVPQELDYLQRHDRAMTSILNIIDMPDATARNFIMFMRQNGWKLPRKRREGEFAKLTDAEAVQLQTLVQDAFDGFTSYRALPVNLNADEPHCDRSNENSSGEFNQ